MISFRMKILSYTQSGTYTVEYVPTNPQCTPIKLNINIDTSLTNTREAVLSLLKNSSPQNYWENELRNSTAVDHSALMRLVNTTHEVTSIDPTPVVNPVNIPAMPERLQPIPSSYSIAGMSSPERLPAGARSSPERIATPDVMSKVKMKLLIQEVLREMAENTV